MKKRYTEEQIIGSLKEAAQIEADAGKMAPEARKVLADFLALNVPG